MDLSPVGGLNYNGIETFQREVEVLRYYQKGKGIIPSQSSVQKAAYKLHQVGNQHIPFHCKQCNLGEVYQSEFERFVHFIL